LQFLVVTTETVLEFSGRAVIYNYIRKRLRNSVSGFLPMSVKRKALRK